MADKDLKLLQEQGDGSFLEKDVTPVAGQFLGFDGSKNPVSADTGFLNLDGGDAIGGFAQVPVSPVDGGDATSF